MYSRLLRIVILLAVGALEAAAQTSTATTYVFPLFVNGSSGGSSYRSVLRLSNTSSTPTMQCSLNQRNTAAQFVGIQNIPTQYTTNVIQAGISPLSQTQVILSPSLPLDILRTNGQGALTTGYATLSCPASVSAQLQFALYDANNNKLGEAAIPPATQGNSFQFLIDTRDGTRLGFSLANDSAIGGQFEVIARDQFNQIVAQAFSIIQPNSQVSEFVDEVPGLGLPANFVGSIEIVGVPGSSSYVTGLQFTGPVFSTVLPIVRSKAIGS
jgi:hypothetical protein